jgi:hypothetical protein
LLVAAVIAFVGTVPLGGIRWAFTPILLIPLLAVIWAWRAGTDVFPDRLTVKALFGSTEVPWARIAEIAPDRQGRVSALLDNGNVIRLTGVTTANLPTVIEAAGQSIAVDDAVDQGDSGEVTA